MDVDSAMPGEPDQDPSADSTTANTVALLSNESQSSSPQLQQEQSNNSTSGAIVGGPRCAPTYTVVNAIIEKKEDGPGPRCGHTLTAVPAVGEEGSPGYIGPRLILFGGATALEGNSAASGTPSAGSAGIRMFSYIF